MSKLGLGGYLPEKWILFLVSNLNTSFSHLRLSLLKEDGELGEVGRHAPTHAGMELDTEPDHALLHLGVTHAKENLLPRQNSAIDITVIQMASHCLTRALQPIYWVMVPY